MKSHKEYIYLDNAASTALDPEAKEAMVEVLDYVGNPSSIHAYGRESKTLLEKSRKTIAHIIGASPAEILFTSGGTESINTILKGFALSQPDGVILSSALEHHAVIHTLDWVRQYTSCKIELVHHDSQGTIDLDHLDNLLKTTHPKMVALMHANNEIANLLDVQKTGELCSTHGAVFFSDMVQSVGYLPIHMSKLGVHAASASAHKFHGPKGVGFLYANTQIPFSTFIHGGAQERNRRGGTENVAAIVGMAKALEVSYRDLEQNTRKIQTLKSYFIEKVKYLLPEIEFGGLSYDMERSLYKTVSIRFPNTDFDEMFVFKWDVEHIAVSGGSACSSGALQGSHVLQSLYGKDDIHPTLRFSFSKFNTLEELDNTMAVLVKFFNSDKSLYR